MDSSTQSISTTLYLDTNEITNVSPLAGMTGLTTLSLQNNRYRYLARDRPENLTSLHLTNNQIADIPAASDYQPHRYRPAPATR